MRVRCARKHGFVVMRICGPVRSGDEGRTVVAAIQDVLLDGSRQIAISFEENACLYSPVVSVLAHAIGLVRLWKGSLVVIPPSIDFLHALQATRLTDLLTICPSENDLPRFADPCPPTK